MLLALVAQWAVLATDAHAQPDRPPAPPVTRVENADGQEKEIDAWTRKLTLTGPEREDAVVNLMSMTSPRAHEPLIRALDRAVDSVDGAAGNADDARRLELARLILNELRRSFGNHRHPVFGVGDARDSMRRSYMRPVVQLYVPLVEGKPHPLQEAAGDCLRQLPTAERRNGAKLLLGTPSHKLQQATLLALGDSWDLGMAPFLAGYLGDPALVVAAIRALKQLTFQDLRTKAEYEEWWAANKSRTYMDIAVAAARDAEQNINRERERYAGEIRRAYAEIVDILMTSKRPDRWKQIQGYIFAPRLGVMQACLVKLQDRLRDGVELVGGAEASDRLTLWAALHKELAMPGVQPGRYALLLEVTSHLIAANETRERGVQEQLLRKALNHESVEVALAALRGLRQFPSPDNRLAVVRLAMQVRAASANAANNANNAGNAGNANNAGNNQNTGQNTGRNGNTGQAGNPRPSLLAEALGTLKSAGWTAPLPGDKDYKEWLQALSTLLLDDRLDGFLRQEVVKTLAKADKNNGHPAGVQKELSVLAGRATEDLSLRQAALLELPQVLTDVESADRYVKFLVNLLQDKEEEVRREAATQLKRLPYERDRANEQRAAWQKLLLENLTIDELLGSENSERVFVVLLDRLVGLAKENEDHSGAVFERLSRAIRTVHEQNKPETAFKIPLLKQGIIDYATAKDRHAIEWVRACEALVAVPVQDRKSALGILEARTVKLEAEKDEIRTRYRKMRIELALLAGGSDNGGLGNGTDTKAHDGTALPWSVNPQRSEAIEVIASLESLAKISPPPAELSRSDVRLLWLSCLAGTAQYDKLVKLATPWLIDSDTTLEGSDRVAATLLLALAHLEQRKPKEAVSRVQSLVSGSGAAGDGSRLPDDKAGLILVETIATLMLASARDTARGQAPDADMLAVARLLASHVSVNTDPKDPAYLSRQLLHLEAQGLGADNTTKSGLRGQLDRLFSADGVRVPEGLRARVQRLRRELGG